jgi:hypothetical protein
MYLSRPLSRRVALRLVLRHVPVCHSIHLSQHVPQCHHVWNSVHEVRLLRRFPLLLLPFLLLKRKKKILKTCRQLLFLLRLRLRLQLLFRLRLRLRLQLLFLLRAQYTLYVDIHYVYTLGIPSI